jgi:citrate synthase
MLPRARRRTSGGTRKDGDERLLTSRQAAERLGVKLETLYAYVARRLLHGVAKDGAGPQERRYTEEELEGFLARRRWSRRVVSSAISSTDGGRLLYRGHDAVALAERASFEQVASLLWTGELGEGGEWPEVEAARIEAAARAASAVPGAPPLLQAQILVAALAIEDDTRGRVDAVGVRATGTKLVTRLVAALAAVRGTRIAASTRGPMAARVLSALGGSPGAAAVRMTDRALVLSAEHELNASTFAARVAASTGADPYAVVGAGVATLSGPKHGGMTDLVEAVFRGGWSPDVDPPLGFGHALYPDGDPRTPPLLAAAGEAARRGSALATIFACVHAMGARGRPAPTVDVGLAATSLALGLVPGLASTLFALGRTAGWLAHAIEQYGMGELIRPRARYVGPRPEEG